MLNFVNFEQCCLCNACSRICPVNAIEYNLEYKSFYYPQINIDKCIKCNQCRYVCPAIQDTVRILKNNFPVSYAARTNDCDALFNSTSGGIFFEAAKYVIENSGYVCGAVFDDDFHVKHTVTQDINVIKAMRGSKYAQSATTAAFRKVKELLAEEKPILFCGCPCQIAGLQSYLKTVPEHLILIDFVCHGIPSDKMLQKYIDLQEQTMKSKVVSFMFRNKKFGWHNSCVNIQFENGKEYVKPIIYDAYMKGFLQNIVLKESCYTCRYKKLKSGSDITLGDLWGAEIEFPNIDDNTGLSGVVINTEKGKKLFDCLKIEKYPCTFDQIEKYNKNLSEPSKKNERRDAFFSLAEKTCYENAIKKMLQEKHINILKRNLRSLLRQMYYRIIGQKF